MVLALGLLSLLPTHIRAQDRLTAIPLSSLEAFAEAPTNWTLVSDVMATRHSSEWMSAVPGTGVLINTPTEDSRGNLLTAWSHGDLELRMQFMMPKGSNSGYLQGRYEVQLYDSWGKRTSRLRTREAFTNNGLMNMEKADGHPALMPAAHQACDRTCTLSFVLPGSILMIIR